MEEDAGIGLEEAEHGGAEQDGGDTDNDDVDDDDKDTEVTVGAGSGSRSDPDAQMAHTYGITPEQLKKLREGFQLFSTADYLLSANFGNALRACGQTPTEAELTAVLKDAESSEKALLSFEDFVRLSARFGLKADMEQERELEVAMAVLDKDGTGYIDATRFRQLIKNLGEPIPDEEISEMLKMCDVRPDGKFAFFPLMKKLMSK